MNTQQIKNAYRGFLDTLYPRRCFVCDGIALRGSLICEPCKQKLNYVTPPTCARCGKQVFSARDTLCTDCRHQTKHFTRGYALLNYDEAAQATMVKIKYKNKPEYIEALASLMCERFGETLSALAPDYLVPVPIDAARLKERGYNQAALMASYIGRSLSILVLDHSLVRSRPTLKQKELNPEQRLNNLTDAFSVTSLPANAEKLVIIDDIYTTGSTAEACTRALHTAGAKDIYVLCACIGSER